METFQAIKQRSSVRKYLDKPVSREALEKIAAAGQRAATANNLQPVEFIVATDPAVRKKMSEIAPKNGPYMAFAPAVIAVVSRPEKYFLEDGAAATQNLLVMARDLGLGTVWVAGDKKEYAPAVLKLLGVPQEYKLISLVCVGYPEGGFPVTEKKPLSQVLHWERF